jgi:hypothetical protein
MHRVAARVATEQAALRKSIGDLFHNLARRSQGLVDRQLELIDELERGEADPDRLAEMFRIDHLATRMRRNAENLIVLSGVERHRRWSEPVPMPDVVEAAVAEVEDYPRVEVTGIHDLTLSGQAASDVAHLLAELVENATSFSPPTTRVEITGHLTASGYVVEIEDRGVGMSDAELVEANKRLAAPSPGDIAVSRMMGVHVVGRLAARHGIAVQSVTPGTAGSPPWCCCQRPCSARQGRPGNAPRWRGLGRPPARPRRNRSRWPRSPGRAGSRASTFRCAGTPRRYRIVMEAPTLPLRQASRWSRRRPR